MDIEAFEMTLLLYMVFSTLLNHRHFSKVITSLCSVRKWATDSIKNMFHHTIILSAGNFANICVNFVFSAFGHFECRNDRKLLLLALNNQKIPMRAKILGNRVFAVGWFLSLCPNKENGSLLFRHIFLHRKYS